MNRLSRRWKAKIPPALSPFLGRPCWKVQFGYRFGDRGVLDFWDEGRRWKPTKAKAEEFARKFIAEREAEDAACAKAEAESFIVEGDS